MNIGIVRILSILAAILLALAWFLPPWIQVQTFAGVFDSTTLTLLQCNALSLGLGLAFFLPLAVAALTLLGGIIALLTDSEDLARLADLVGAIGGGLGLAALVVGLPQIERLLLCQGALLDLAPHQLAWGYWGCMATVVLLAAVSVVGLFSARPRRPSRPTYRPVPPARRR